MTHRKKPKNKTIVKEAMKQFDDYGINNPPSIETGKQIFYDIQRNEIIGDNFVFPNDLDHIQPDQINGNLTIKFPD